MMVPKPQQGPQRQESPSCISPLNWLSHNVSPFLQLLHVLAFVNMIATLYHWCISFSLLVCVQALKEVCTFVIPPPPNLPSCASCIPEEWRLHAYDYNFTSGLCWYYTSLVQNALTETFLGGGGGDNDKTQSNRMISSTSLGQKIDLSDHHTKRIL